MGVEQEADILLKKLRLENFLSFGETNPETELGDLNIVIGPNGSGKSNLIEAIDLIRSTPGTSTRSNLLAAIRDGGGVRDWLWKGTATTPRASIDAVFEHSGEPRDLHDDLPDLRYVLSFSAVGQRFEIVDERIELAEAHEGHEKPCFFYRMENGHGVLNVKGDERRLRREGIDLTASILSRRKDPDQYPELTYLGEVFSKMHLYREWSFGRSNAPRLPQGVDLPNEHLEPDASNLGLVLNRCAPAFVERQSSVRQDMHGQRCRRGLRPGLR